MGVKIKPCPICGTAWVYASVGDYGSGYEHKGYRIECKCGFAWKTIRWCDNKDEAIKKWNAEVHQSEYVVGDYKRSVSGKEKR